MPASSNVQTTRSAKVNPSTLVRGFGVSVCDRSRDPSPAARISAISDVALFRSGLVIAQNFHDFIAQFPARRRDQADAVGQAFRCRQGRAIEADDPAPRLDH